MSKPKQEESEKYPECRKLHSVREQSQKIGEFLHWLVDQNIHLAKFDSDGDVLEAHYESTEKLLARFFEIDLEKVEAERRAIIEELQSQAI